MRILAAGALIFLFALFLFFNLIFIPPSANFPAGEIISIEGGLNLNEVASFLRQKDVVKSSFVFRLVVNALGGEKSVKAGGYLFDKPYSAFEIAKKTISGDYGIEYEKILIREGEAIEDVGRIFEENGFFKKEELFAAAGCCAGKILPKAPLGNGVSKLEDDQLLILEGFLFPDTYLFAKNISAKEAVKAMLGNFNRKTSELQKKAANLSLESRGKNFYDILIMASILEKEAHFTEDKKIIADILWRRLNKEMPLQVDATLQYITGRNTFELTKDDLNTGSPYNTYKYKGLPPTPISNPGLDSIEAAIFPAENLYWYYLSDKSGTLYYSKTFQEHKTKKEKYL